jgi:hypothetical protein
MAVQRSGGARPHRLPYPSEHVHVILLSRLGSQTRDVWVAPEAESVHLCVRPLDGARAQG